MTGRPRGLRIGMIAGSRFPVAEPFAGGLEAHTWLLATRLERLGDRVTVFAPPGSDPRLRLLPLPAPVRLSDAARADVSAGPASVMAEHHAYLGVMLRLQAATPEFDVVHNNSGHHLPVAMARATPVPMVTTLHTPPTPWLESALALGPPPTASAFVAVSRHTAAAWSHLVPGIRVIPNGIDMDTWTPGPGGRDLVWCGRIVPEKAPHLAIDAARAAGMRLRLAGPVHDPAYWLAEIAPRLGPDARWVGHLAGAALRSLVGASAAMLITPEWDEPYGLVALESLACGTPVAAVGRGGLREIPDAGSGVLVDGGDVDALAHAARAAARLDRRACRRRARDIGCAGRMAAGYRRVYAELAEAA